MNTSLVNPWVKFSQNFIFKISIATKSIALQNYTSNKKDLITEKHAITKRSFKLNIDIVSPKRIQHSS